MNASYSLNDRVQITYRNFDLATDEMLGYVTEMGTITRVWTDQKTITIRTDSGKTYVRQIESENVKKVS